MASTNVRDQQKIEQQVSEPNFIIISAVDTAIQLLYLESSIFDYFYVCLSVIAAITGAEDETKTPELWACTSQ